jgi:hypothetical protein
MGSLKFFAIGGVILILSGAMQLFVRPRKPNEHRYLNRGTIWAVFCVLVGLAAILVGTGMIPLASL